MAKLYSFLLFFCFMVIIPTFDANVKEDEVYWQKHIEGLDAYWQERAAVAEKVNKEAFSPDPYAVSGNLTSIVSE